MEINFSSYIELLTYPIRLKNLSSVRTLFSEMLILLNSSYRFEQRIKTIVVFDCTNCILLKGIWQRGGFSEVFLQKSVRHRFLTLKFEPFRFGLRIRGDIRNRKTTRRVGESTRMPLDTIFFKPLNQSMVIVHNIPAFLFAKFLF